MAKEKEVKKGKAKYDSSSIDMQRFPDNIRHSPGMYIGGIDGYSRWITAKENLDNALDEHLAKRNNFVQLFVTKDREVVVIDEGHGIPQGIKSYEVNVNGKTIKAKMPTMQAIFGELHTSGKYRSEAYQTSIGTHGVGAKATNATAEYFKVWTCFEGQWYHIAFKKGRLSTPVEKCKAPKSPEGVKLKKGTMIVFKHDETIFKKSSSAMPLNYAREWAEVMSYINPGLTLKISEADAKGKYKTDTYFSKNGPKDYIAAQLKKLDVAAESKILEFKNDLISIFIAFSGHTECALKGFTNGSYNRDGGRHVDVTTGALYKALLDFDGKASKEKDKVKEKVKAAKKKGKAPKAKGNGPAFTEADVREGLVGMVNAMLHKPTFNSQDKVKLSDDRMNSKLEQEITESFIEFFKDNKALATRLRDQAIRMNQARSKFVASKAVASALGKLKKDGLPANYSGFNPKTAVEDRELFLVEGDSAAGGIRKTKMPWQSLLPLRGKVFNVLKSKQRKSKKGEKDPLLSEAVLNILTAIGYDPKAKDPIAKLTVGKIIFVADPDPDGCHINSLLCGLIYKMVPEMFNRGMVCIVNMPEFYSVYNKQLVTGLTLSDVRKKLDKVKAPKSHRVLHAKGWGEMDASLMKPIAIDAKTRHLIQIKPLETADKTEFVYLMDENVEYRRELLRLPGSKAAANDAEAAASKEKKGSKVKAKKRKVSNG
ncbi:DNA topoisomerase large subunit [Burkholderia phage BCSR5]|nr:DNA topoisomerase large subunit [Burkholderia phage BCSR5]